MVGIGSLSFNTIYGTPHRSPRFQGFIIYGVEVKKLLQDLQSRNKRMFLLTFFMMNTTDTKQEPENIIFGASGIVPKHN